jgi:tRNA threonylcarbamoyladenosine biosynthesis protein TsaB
MKILSLDTATEACSAALLVDNQVDEVFEVLGRGHAERILPMVAEVLRRGGLELHDLDAIAVGRGPGAFTGVRIAISTAQGLSLGSGVPLVPISELYALGVRALGQHPKIQFALVCLDARMGEVYWGMVARTKDGFGLVDEGLAAPADVPLPVEPLELLGVGHGFRAYERLCERVRPRAAHIDVDMLPHAADIAYLAVAEVKSGRMVAAARLEPTYLRNDVAMRSTKP